MMVYTDSGLKNATSVSNGLAIKMNRRGEEADIPVCMTKRKTTLI